MKTDKSHLAPQTQPNTCAFNRRLKRTQLSTKRNDAGSMFQIRGQATANKKLKQPVTQQSSGQRHDN